MRTLSSFQNRKVETESGRRWDAATTSGVN